MLATFLPLPDAAATNTYTDTACEGQELKFAVQQPRQDIWNGPLTYKIRVTDGNAEEGQDYKKPAGSLAFTGNGIKHIRAFSI